ncbi:hypothetical protein SS1G_14464 [Sclerotinia sclerotiorum 1980 UF-70]|uniref:Pterin-binding domain-containing protein n=1 Tax=Sclerotinia sclerotiorum (strain ATCC 18683 / 1980 / Ss-1) TaxID=665079 RepID=A7FA33_SCLS1|nr:hypothetical protein SS1G_14464 [Sclerotinia sclerotiorum 1980 UF-70]EDO00594.1 hypothetical protein SS1G_14464 [Sclerotinia sclerotiorum 1980 UF-70]
MSERGIKIKRTSGLWETEPMYVLDQNNFLNGACEVETTLQPLALLDELQAIENEMGRKKIVDKGPRNIDLDILLYGNEVVDHPRLQVPHPDGGENCNDGEFIRDKSSQIIADGATIIDVGGQSTAPGAPEVSPEVEVSRVLPTIQGIKDGNSPKNVAISIDTYRASVARAAVEAGADIINDVSSGQQDPDMLSTMAQLGKTVCLMHMRGTPATMNTLTNYEPEGLIPTIAKELLERVAEAEAAGIRRWRIILDPGIGFAKTQDQNLEILRRMDELRDWPGLRGLPWLIGTSRKKFIGNVTGVKIPRERDWGTAATVTAAIQGGADIVRWKKKFCSPSP